MKGFNETTLGQILMFQRGFDITKKEQTFGGVPIVSSSGISSYHSEFKVEGPGVVIGRKGTLGTVHFIAQNFWPHDTTLWIKDFKGNDPKFIYYFLQTLHLEKFDTGSSNPTLNRNHVHKIKVFFPNIVIQKKIAAILSAYDDLIENNTQRIQILENITEELYREWFVRFRFPNWENTEFEKGMPKDWEIIKISNLVDRKKFGRIYKEFEVVADGNVPIIDQSQKDILGFHEGEAEHKASFESPMIIFGDHSCKMQLMFKSFSLAENVIPFKNKDNISLLYLFSLIKNQVETTEYKRHWGELTNKKVLVAPLTLQEKYTNLIIDKMKLIEILKTKNSLLVNNRDQLLPRLISGKLSVGKLDIQFPTSMQEL